jgi:hypothetical protein
MAVKWIWGFESGADKTFYSGSGWQETSWRQIGSGSSNPTNDAEALEISLQSGKYTIFSENTVDYACNFPHQPPSVVGGGQFSLKLPAIPALPLGYSSFSGSWPSNMPPTKDGPQDVTSSAQNSFLISAGSYPKYVGTPIVEDFYQSGCISLSVFTDFELTNYPMAPESGSSNLSNLYIEHILSIYPARAKMLDASNIYNWTGSDASTVFGVQYAGPAGSSVGQPLTSGSYVWDVPPLISIYNVVTASAGVKSSYLGFISTVSTSSIVQSPFGEWMLHNKFATGAFDSLLFANGISSSNDIPTWQTLANKLSASFVSYTGSDGVYLEGNKWSKLSLFYNPDPTNSTLKVYVDGTQSIDLSGVGLGYTSSYEGQWDGTSSWSASSYRDDQNLARLSFANEYFGYPNPNIGETLSWNREDSYRPPKHYYDHIVMFDDASDLSTATSSIFIDRFIPDQDISTGSYVGNDSGTTDLFDYIDDTNYFLNNSYLQTDVTSSLNFSLTGIYETKAGHASWSIGNISEIIGLNSINLVSSSVATAISGASSLYAAGVGGESSVSGTSNLISGKQFTTLTTGSTSLGNSWNYLTGNSGVGPGSQIVHAGLETKT